MTMHNLNAQILTRAAKDIDSKEMGLNVDCVRVYDKAP